MTIEFLLRRHGAPATARPLAMARRTLDAMADGGIRDQLGGGFHRYATDALWLVPHFEQMLYDNAQLARVVPPCVAAVTGDDGATGEVAIGVARLHAPRAAPRRRRVRREPGRRHRGRRGRDLHLAGDGDPRGARGRRRPLFAAAYGVTEERQLGGRTILSRVRPTRSSPSVRDAGVEAALARVAGDAPRASRRARPAGPRRQGARGLERAGDRGVRRGRPAARATTRKRGRGASRRRAAAARRASGAACSAGRTGRLRRSWKDGRATAQGVLEDYANLADGLLALYEATFDERWFTLRARLADAILERFADPAGGFFDTADDDERAHHPARRTCRTTPCRRAARWRRPCCCGSRR